MDKPKVPKVGGRITIHRELPLADDCFSGEYVGKTFTITKIEKVNLLWREDVTHYIKLWGVEDYSIFFPSDFDDGSVTLSSPLDWTRHWEK